MPGVQVSKTFDELIAEGSAAPVDGWDFSWFDGRATEERPPWHYSQLITKRMRSADAVLDVQTGGAEVFAEALERLEHAPGTVAATESWPPNLALARGRLARYGGTVAEVGDAAALPFEADSFDLVLSRFPTNLPQPDLARVLKPGGSYLAQLIGDGTNRDLFEFMMGPQPRDPVSRAEHVTDAVRSAGLELVTLDEVRTRVEFFDVAAIVVFLRKVVWTVPDFTVSRYLERLRAAHERIRSDGVFVSHSTRMLVDARKPA